MTLEIKRPTKDRSRANWRIERKFFILPRNIGVAYGLLRQLCLADSTYHSEQINSLYFDTTDLDQYERSASGDFRKDKVRIRWYGEDKDLHGMQPVFLELKSRRGFAGTKQRRQSQLPADYLATNRLGRGIISKTLLADTLADFGYFPPEMLQPVIKISYWRYRFSEMLTGASVALDCRIRSTMVARELGYGERELELPGGVLEVKGPDFDLPLTLRRIRIMDLDWSRFSKYSICVDSHTETPGSIGRLSPSGKII